MDKKKKRDKTLFDMQFFKKGRGRPKKRGNAADDIETGVVVRV